MKIYELNWSWYEDYQPHLFAYKEEKTKKQWESDCKKAIRAVGDEYLKQEKSWAGANHWIEFAGKKLLEYGYISIQPVSFGVFGSYIIEYKDGLDADDLVFKKIVGKELFAKAVAHNKKIEASLNE